MPSNRISFLIIACLVGGTAFAQADSLRVDTTASAATADTITILDWRARHKPGRAALYSAVLPGAGQIYNRKYWKAPIVWAGLGTCVYFIQDNTKQYNRYKDAYLDVINGRADEFEGKYSADQLRNVADTYHRWRDLSYVAVSLVYILNIVDASVDGYFVRFDVNEDLSLDLRPSLPMAARGALGLSLSVHL